MVERAMAKHVEPLTQVKAARAVPARQRPRPRVEARIVPSNVHVVDPYDRVAFVKGLVDTAAEGRQKPVLVLFNDATERYHPELTPDVQFIDAAGGMCYERNVQHVSNPAFLEMVHARILKTIQAGARRIVIDDAQMLRFYNGDGPTHAFFHSLSAAAMLHDVHMDIVLPDTAEAGPMAKALRTWTS